MSILRRPLRYQNFGAVYWLIGINVIIYVAGRLLGRNFIIYQTELLSMIPARIIQSKWIWTFVTYMFMHGNFQHILFNMLGLLIFGIHVERQMGSNEFLLYYFITGTLAGVFSFFAYCYTKSYFVALMGASGALFAVELAFAVFFPDSIIYIWGLIPLRAPVMVIGYTVLELFFSITGRNNGVAHLTHLAGFGFGWIYFLVRFGINPWRRLFRR